MPTPTLPALQAHIAQHHPTIKLLTPTHPAFERTRACFIHKLDAAPLAIARPQSAADVQALVRYCVTHDIDFVVRAGGHDCAGRSQVAGALSLDVRDLNGVVVSDDRKTATIGGGTVFRDLTRVLDARGLVTPVGTVASVGYAGWASLGGYGIFTNNYGLGADQIVAAKVVNAKGELVEADAELLKGIRGGGGIFGVIVELTIKVYPLNEILVSMLVFESTDLKSTWSSYAAGYEKLFAEESVPKALQLQPFGIELPGLGKVLAIGATWSSPDHDQGHRWIGKLSEFGTCLINNPESKSVTSQLEFTETLVAYGSYGRAYTLNIKSLTQKTAAVLAKHTALLPGGGIAASLHTLRDPTPSEASVFGSRVDHQMLELVAMTPQKDLEPKGAEWARRLLEDLGEADPENIMDSSYVSLLDDEDSNYEKIYGSYYEELVNLKVKLDPQNVFKYAVPRLSA